MSIVQLSSRYWNEGYVAKTVACECLQEYDNGSSNQIDVRREELTAWRGEHADRLSLGF